MLGKPLRDGREKGEMKGRRGVLAGKEGFDSSVSLVGKRCRGRRKKEHFGGKGGICGLGRRSKNILG